uniref:Uncharacterized protein n=1 Tax=Anguilla anguilla TaxID=7936 RepID=A0A0E9SVG4_ANGAN
MMMILVLAFVFFTNLVCLP